MKILRLCVWIVGFAVLTQNGGATTVSYAYDSLNRLTRVAYPDGTTIAYTYDAAGNRLSQTTTGSAATLPQVSIDKTILSFSAVSGQTPPAQAVTVTNAGAGTLSWSVVASVDWLTITPASGTGTGSINITASATHLSGGTYNGALFIVASASNTPLAIPVALTVTGASGNPTISTNGITSAAGFTQHVARGSVTTVFGTSLADSPVAASTVPLPLMLNNVEVTVNGIAAPLWYVDSGQINFQMPFESPLQGQASVVIKRGGIAGLPGSITLTPYAPSIFVYSLGDGTTAPIIVHAANNQLVTSGSPAVPGEYVIAYGTGIGDLTTLPITGDVSPSAPVAAANAIATATIGGIQAPVFFSGLTPRAVGLAQFNVQVPQGLPLGTSLPFVISFGTVASQPVQLYVVSASSSGGGPAQIAGRVVWDGAPVPNAGVEIKLAGDYYQLPALLSTQTGSDGRFVFANPPAGNFTIYAVAPSIDFWDWVGHPLTVVDGKQIDVGDLSLSKKLQLLSPVNGSVISTTAPTLQWTAFPGTISYDVSVFNNKTSESVFQQSTPATQITVSPALKAGEQYQWSVYANDANGQIAYWSAWYFTVSQ